MAPEPADAGDPDDSRPEATDGQRGGDPGAGADGAQYPCPTPARGESQIHRDTLTMRVSLAVPESWRGPRRNSAQAPWEAAAWGGQHLGVLPRHLRVASGVTALVVYPVVTVIILALSGLVPVDGLPGTGAAPMWVLTVPPAHRELPRGGSGRG